MKTRKTIFSILAILFGILTFYGQDKENINITISNIESDEGFIIIGLYKKPENFLKKPFKGLKLEAKKGEISAVFENIEPGIYAISLFHDENGNGKLDTNFIGIPKESYAASNNAKGSFGPPKWEDAKFSVSTDQKTEQKIKL